MKRFYLIALLISLSAVAAQAQSTFIPASWRTSTDSNGTVYTQNDGLTLYKHELSSDHFDVYYGTGYGTTPPDKLASSNALYVNVKDLLEKAEGFYDLYINKLKFADLSINSKLNKYKMIICLLHDTGWTATGSGYDNQIGALWVTPSTCHPVGQTIAHEIGHSFQYQVYCDLGGYTGFRQSVGNGSTFWEQTAQWQSVQAYPNLMISQSIDLWQHNHNYAFTHEWQRYQSYWLHYYWADKHGIDAIGRVWRGGTVSGEDPCQVYMRVFGVSVHDFYKEIYDYASKMATYDIDEIRQYGASSIGRYTYNYVDTDDGKLQVAYSSCPQSTGFNVIPLQVPEAGTEVKTVFTALPAGRTDLLGNDPKQYHNGDRFTSANVSKYNSFTGANTLRGFRHGYVALLKNGTRVYHSTDTVYGVATTSADRYKAMNDTTTFVVPEGTDRLFFIVAPAPTEYIVHKWDENITNDDQWPYQLEFTNTDIVGHQPRIDLSDTSILPHDTLIHIYMGMNSPAADYATTPYTLSTSDMVAIGKALRVQPSEISGLLRSYSASQANNTIQFVGLNAGSATTAVVEGGSTANGYGHWFNNTGNVCTWGASAYIFSELETSNLTFNIGLYPGRYVAGKEYKFGQAFRYKDSKGNVGVAKLVFHVFCGGVPTGIEETESEKTTHDNTAIYNLQGQRLNGLHRGINIVGGKKILVR